MKNLPKVSIVLCTYNGGKFLPQQLQSIIHQTYLNVEIIISDDHSRDNTIEIARHFQKIDSRIRIYVNEKNLGYNQNFEQAFDLATGDFIAVSDQDDIWKPNKIAEMMPLFSKKTMLVYCQSVRFENTIPDIDKYSKRNLFTGSDVRKLMYYNSIAGHNIIFRKELLKYAKPFPYGVFYDWWLTIIAAGTGGINATERVYTFQRFHSNNVTLRKKKKKFQTRLLANERLLTLKHVLQLDHLKEDHLVFGEKLYAALKTLESKRFSPQLLFFLLLNSGIVFFFKKRPWSRAKMAYRLSSALE